MSASAVTILHVDMDAFYASVEQRDNPELRGQPVIVGGSAESRGVVCAASYEARKFGVHSAMPSVTARRLCPQGVFLPVRMSHYAQIARDIRAILLSFTPLVQPLSLDEAFLDVRGCEGLFGSAPEIGKQIKARIRAELDLVASVGVATNNYLAKLASDLGKPDGFVVIEPERTHEILAPLPVSRIWGVGKKAEKRLKDMGIDTIGQVAAMPEAVFVQAFGESGRHMWRLAHGQDDRSVIPDEDAKSVSTETTFPRDIGDRDVLRGWLLELVEQLGRRLRLQQLRARTIELKVRTSAFDTHHRSFTLDEGTDVTQEIWRAASKLLRERVPDGWLPLRLLGVGAAGLVRAAAQQGRLFEDEWTLKHRAVDKTLDSIRAQFGQDAIRRAEGMDRPESRGEAGA
jgi:DNA polymerase IV